MESPLCPVVVYISMGIHGADASAKGHRDCQTPPPQRLAGAGLWAYHPQARRLTRAAFPTAPCTGLTNLPDPNVCCSLPLGEGRGEGPAGITARCSSVD